MLGLNATLRNASANPAATSADRGYARPWNPIRTAIAAVRTRMELRAAEAQLHALDWRMLKDIGLERSEILSVLTDPTGERRDRGLSPQDASGAEKDVQHSNATQEAVTALKAVAVSFLMLTAAIMIVAALATAASNVPGAQESLFTGTEPSIDPSAIMRNAPRELRVESYPLH